MKIKMNSKGKKEIVFLSRTDLEMLIYMTSDVWITPELKRFKNEILEKAGVSKTGKNRNNHI